MNKQIEDDDNILRDGQALRVSMFAMDGVQREIATTATGPNVRNSKGYGVRSQAEQAMVSDALADRDKRLVSAFNGSHSAKPTVPAENRDDDALSPSAAVAARDAAFAARLERNANAWKTAS